MSKSETVLGQLGAWAFLTLGLATTAHAWWLLAQHPTLGMFFWPSALTILWGRVMIVSIVDLILRTLTFPHPKERIER